MAAFPELDAGDVRLSAADVPDDVRQRARLTVARNALDVEDCRELLDMLGLLSTDGEDGSGA